MFKSESTTCRFSEQNFNECIRNSFQQNFPNLHNPRVIHKEYPTIDPYFFDYASIVFNRTKTVRGIFTLRNMTLAKGSSIKFNDLKAEFNETGIRLRTRVSVQQLISSGWFKNDISFFDVRFASLGEFKLICDEITATFVIKGSFDDDGTRVKVKSFEMQPLVKKMIFDVKRKGVDEKTSKKIYF